ncbi:MAG: glycosyltransferase family 2 protein [Methylococcaceae bacterium]
MKIWICIPVFNRKQLTLKCLASLHQQTFINFTVIVCDHGSTDGTSAAIQQQFPEVIVIQADNSLWWTGAINRCVSYTLEHAANEDTLLTLNDDTELPEDYLFNLAKNYRKYPGAIITSVIHDIKTGQLVSPGYRQNWLIARETPVSFKTDHLPDDPNVVEVTHASGRGALFPISAFQQLGLFDDQHLPHYGADYDFTFKAARANYKIYSCLDCKVLSYVDDTGLVKVLNKFSRKGLIAYFTSIRSPASIKVRWWYGWNNCPKRIFPIYMIMDFIRVLGGYFKHFIQPKII